jgi:hypothetical protein
MATVDRYKIVIDTQGTEKIIDINDELDNLGTKISNAAKIGVAAFGALTVSAARMADQLVDLSGVAGMSVGKIYQMSVAAEAAGGSFDDVGGMLLKFSNSVTGAIEGNDKLRDSFAQIGISRDELARLDDEQLFQAVVQGLGAMEDGAEKTALAIDLLGKKAATINLRQFAEATSGAADPEIERLFNNAADAIGKLETAFRSLQLAALQTVEPILEAIGKFEFSVADAQKAIQVLGTVIAGVFAASTVSLIFKMIDAFKEFRKELLKVGQATAFLTALTGPRGLFMVGAAALAAAGAYTLLESSISEVADEQEQYNALIERQTELENNLANVRGRSANARRRQIRAELQEVTDQIAQLESTMGASSIATPGAAPVTTADAGRQLELSQREQAALAAVRTTEQMIYQNEQANELRRTLIGIIGIEQNRASLQTANAQATETANNKIFDLQTQIQAETAKGEQANQIVIDQLNEQKIIIEEQLQTTLTLNAQENLRIRRIDNINRQLENQLSLIDAQTAGVESLINAAIMQEQAAGNVGALFADAAQRSAREAAQNQITLIRLEKMKEAARLQGLGEEVVRIENLITLENTRHESVMDAIYKENAAFGELERSRVAGVISAMEQISQQFTPYSMAQDAILSTWNNIGSAIDDVARGGKASFGDMARSIIADLGAMIAKAMVFNAIKTAFSAFGFSLPGLATGGPAQAGQPYIVGEKGPELFIPKNAGTVIPNNKLGSQSAAAPAQKAPQNITNNVYNISAVDAKSVAQLFYENRKTMLGTMNIAQKELPYSMG